MSDKKRFILRMAAVALLAVLCAALSGCARADVEYGAELLQNAALGSVDQYGQPSGWAVDCYVNDRAVSDYGASGGVAFIDSYSENDVRFTQRVGVVKGVTYRFAAEIMAEVVSGGGYGAVLSLGDTFISSPALFSTSGVWQQTELYFRATKTQDIVAEMRLGFYSNDAMGKARFRNVTLTAVEGAPQGALVYDYEEFGAAAYSGSDDKSGVNGYTPLILALAAAMLVFGAVSKRRAERLALSRDGQKIGLAWLCLAAGGALLLRLALAALIYGYSTDVACFRAWSERVVSTGFSRFYAEGYFCDYPPGYIYILWLVGAVKELVGAASMSGGELIIIKLPAMLCDIAAAACIWAAARRRLPDELALLLACLYAFDPMVILDSAAWGQIDGVLALGVVASVWLMCERKLIPASLIFAVSLLIKIQAILVGPLLLFAFIYEIRQTGWQGWKKLIISFVSCAALCLLAALPFSGGHPLTWLIEKYTATMASYEYASVNAMNLFTLLGGNWVAQTEPLLGLTWQIWGTILMALVFAWSAVVALAAGDRRMLPVSGAVFLSGVFCLGVRMHERYMFPALALLLLAYILWRDRRLLGIFILFSVGNFVNCAMVLQNQHLLADDVVITAIFSVVNLAAFGWLCWTAFDMALRKNVVVASAAISAQAKREQAQEAEGEDKHTVDKQSVLAALGPKRTRAEIRLTRMDAIALAVITVLYSVLALVNLGDTVAAQTEYRSTMQREQVVCDLGEDADIAEFTFYGGIGKGSFTVEFSQDGQEWQPAMYTGFDGADGAIEYERNTMFMWHDFPIVPVTARYARITFKSAGIPIIEAAFRTADKTIVTPASAVAYGGREESASDPALMFDEQELVPERSSYMNSMYFDEIYHARTAYEHVTGMEWYETTHPPLGKALMSLCIMAMGMTPFAWRLAGTIAGILMLPGMYLMAKLLFRRTNIAVLATALMSLDCMHFGQTRLATIDSFVVMFIIWMFYFMFRWVLLTDFASQPWRKTLPPLLLSGIFMGLGVAAKWTGAYAGMGLAAVFFVTLAARWLAVRRAGRALARSPKRFTAEEEKLIRGAESGIVRRVVLTLAFCVLAFVVIPVGIYLLSYIQYFRIEGGKTLADLLKAQEYMYSYHSNLAEPHPFQSPWYEWFLMLRPMWYYKGNHDGLIATINGMGNPVIWWTGFGTMLWLLWKRLSGKTRSIEAALLLAGYFAQLLPWMLVQRSTFIYHYFACVPFMILMICWVFDRRLDIAEASGGAAMARKRVTREMIVFLAVTALVFAFFYPVISGIDMPVWYARLTRWLPTWTIWNY